MHEEILRDTLMIDTSGEKVAQVNGLSVLMLGDFTFGQPSRITATTRLGDGQVVDIQREAELGGSIHSKGVMILSSFIASRYAARQPFSLAASLVFEQTYGEVDGDSASMAELCAILSSLAGVPVRQSLAITGSVNQRGEAQAIGAVNEKIEGFFDICSRRGLDGTHAVLIPRANVKHLMLRDDVVEAARDGRFAVHAYSNVDEAMLLLAGETAAPDSDEGRAAIARIDARVRARLAEFTEIRGRFGAARRGGRGQQ